MGMGIVEEILTRNHSEGTPLNIVEALMMAAADENTHLDCSYFLLRREPHVWVRLLSEPHNNNDGGGGGGEDDRDNDGDTVDDENDTDEDVDNDGDHVDNDNHDEEDDDDKDEGGCEEDVGSEDSNTNNG